MRFLGPLLWTAMILGFGLVDARAADFRIDQLSAGTPLAGTETLPMAQGSPPAVNTTPDAIAAYVNSRRNLWGGDNFEQGCTINAVGSPGTFTPNCAVNFITITAPGQTIAAPTFTIPTGATASLVKKSIELVISYSGSFLPAFASGGYAWQVGTPPPKCSGGVTTGCLSAASSSGPDWIECRSIGTSGHVGCAPPLTNMKVPATYTGPLDIVSAASAWWGLRAASASVAATGTQKSINIRRASDNTTTDILILTTGLLDTATANTFCASTTCFVTKWYDQSGHGNDVLQATTGSQPALTFNCIGTYPCITGGATSELLSATITAIPQPLTMSIVTEQTVSNGGGQVFGGFGLAQVGFNVSGTPNSMFAYAGTVVSETAADLAFHAMQTVMSDAAVASAINLDGTEFTGISVGTSSTYTQLSLINNGLRLTEAGIWSSAFSSANRTAMNSNQHTFYGF